MNEDPTYWVAYYHDGSGFAVFPTELQALRLAVENPGMAVRQVNIGEMVTP